MKTILLCAAGLSVCLGTRNEVELVGKKFFGCSPNSKPSGILFRYPEPDNCILIEVLSDSQMKLAVYAREFKAKEKGTLNALETDAETITVFPKVSFTVIGAKTLRLDTEKAVPGTEYKIACHIGISSQFSHRWLDQSLKGKIAPHHHSLMPEHIEFVSPGD